MGGFFLWQIPWSARVHLFRCDSISLHLPLSVGRSLIVSDLGYSYPELRNVTDMLKCREMRT